MPVISGFYGHAIRVTVRDKGYPRPHAAHHERFRRNDRYGAGLGEPIRRPGPRRAEHDL